MQRPYGGHKLSMFQEGNEVREAGQREGHWSWTTLEETGPWRPWYVVKTSGVMGATERFFEGWFCIQLLG